MISLKAPKVAKITLIKEIIALSEITSTYSLTFSRPFACHYFLHPLILVVNRIACWHRNITLHYFCFVSSFIYFVNTENLKNIIYFLNHCSYSNHLVRKEKNYHSYIFHYVLSSSTTGFIVTGGKVRNIITITRDMLTYQDILLLLITIT